MITRRATIPAHSRHPLSLVWGAWETARLVACSALVSWTVLAVVSAQTEPPIIPRAHASWIVRHSIIPPS
jgi:hypothetical protein